MLHVVMRHGTAERCYSPLQKQQGYHIHSLHGDIPQQENRVSVVLLGPVESLSTGETVHKLVDIVKEATGRLGGLQQTNRMKELHQLVLGPPAMLKRLGC